MCTHPLKRARTPRRRATLRPVHILELDTWPRRHHFDLFRTYTQPDFNVTAPVDVTAFHAHVRERGAPFMVATTYVLARAANEYQPFRWRIRGEQVVEHDVVHPSVTAAEEHDDLFRFCALPYSPHAPTFLSGAADALRASREQPHVRITPGQDELLYLSSLPWLAFTGITHAQSLTPPDSIPRLTTGRFTPQNGRLTMPLSVQVHHALMDGRHVAEYFARVQTLLDDPTLLDHGPA